MCWLALVDEGESFNVCISAASFCQGVFVGCLPMRGLFILSLITPGWIVQIQPGTSATATEAGVVLPRSRSPGCCFNVVAQLGDCHPTIAHEKNQ